VDPKTVSFVAGDGGENRGGGEGGASARSLVDERKSASLSAVRFVCEIFSSSDRDSIAFRAFLANF